MTRDNRIGEITNVATSIENKYTTNEEIKELYSNYCSLLRIYQGKEIDFLKTGTRWQMSSGLRKHLKQLPYFLLYNYPQKLKTYNTLKEKNKNIEKKEDKYKLNAYHSPSPMNELCDYICTWEKKNILWDNNIDDLVNTRVLIVDNDLDLSDKKIIRIVRKCINNYSSEVKKHLKAHNEDNSIPSFVLDELVEQFKNKLSEELNIDEELIANYVIKVSYSSFATNKSFAWSAYGDYIIKNLKNNSNPKRSTAIVEVSNKTSNSYEYLGKHYEFKTVSENE